MKHPGLSIPIRPLVLLLLFVTASCHAPRSTQGCDAREPFPELHGPYLGQTPPGEEPVLFAPGIVSTGHAERDVAMTPDGSELYWGVAGGGYAWSVVLCSRLVDGRWTEPEVAACSRGGTFLDLEPHVTPDGGKFLWLSDRPGGSRNARGGQDLWAMDRVGDGWGEPYPLPAPVNTLASEYFPSVTCDGTLYFTRSPAGGGENVIMRSRLVDGVYQEPERLPEQVNAGRNRYNAFVDPEERYVLLTIAGVEDARGGADYYVVFRSADDRWSEPVNLGPLVNTDGAREHSPYVSPDGRYLFFMSGRIDWDALAPGGSVDAAAIGSLSSEPDNGNSDVYWVDASFLDELRPAGF